MDFDDIHLSEANFIMFAMKSYDCSNCLDMKEFLNDIKKIKYVKRLFNRYLNDDDLKERLIINHLIELYNMFGNGATKMLFFKLDDKFRPLLKTFLIYLNRMPDNIYGVQEQVIQSHDIPVLMEVANKLRKI